MKTLIIYTSQTGFTKRYAEWISQGLNGEMMELKDAKKMDDSFFASFDAILYGGWTMGGKVVNADWFLLRAKEWRDKRLAIFVVGASPRANPDVDAFLETFLSEEQKEYIGLFYCQGGISYERMNLASKLMMKSFSTMLLKKKDATEKEREVGKYLSHSYDIAEKQYADDVVDYIFG